MLAAVGLTVALVAIGLGGPWRGEFLAPGPLCSSHARLLGDLQGTDRCAACHDAATSSSSQWLAAVFSAHTPGPVQSEHCLKCHDSTFSGSAPLAAHSVPSTTLAQITQRRSRDSGGRQWLETLVAWPHAKIHHESLACATCHREHHGELDLTTMTDRQCQSCHIERYHSFELDHPEFTQWPGAMPRHLAFDHEAHETKHFPGKGQTYACNSCHESDVTRRVQTLRPFADACASCHAEGIVASTLEGMDLLSLPRLDVATLRAAGLDPGDWPADASSEFDGTFAEPILALLAGDPLATQAMTQLGDLDLAWLESDNPQHLQAVTQLSWSVKRLLLELATGDRDALTLRLTAAGLGQPETQQAFLASLPYAQLEEAIAVWFPDLEFELANRDTQAQTLTPPAASLPSQPQGPDNWEASVAEESSSSPNLTPQAAPDLVAIFSAAIKELSQDRKVLAENPLRNWRPGDRSTTTPLATEPPASATTTPTEPATTSDAPQVASQDLPQETSEDDSPDSTAITPMPAQIPQAALVPTLPAASSGSLLAENPLRHLRAGNAPAPPQETPAEAAVTDHLPTENSQLENPLATDVPAGTTPTQEETSPSSQTIDSQETPPVDTELAEPTTESTDTPELATSEQLPSESDPSLGESPGVSLSSADQVLPWRHEPSQRIGWVRNDAQFRLSYYPQGHADPVLRIWLELLRSSGLPESISTEELAHAMVELARGNPTWITTPIKSLEEGVAPKEPAALAVVSPLTTWSTKLLASNGFGGCARCHLPQHREGGDVMVWQGYRRDVARGEFTAFSHAPHLLTSDSQVCQSCHQLETLRQPELQVVIHRAPLEPHSDFRPMIRSDCANCHRAGQASQACSTCHDYHVGTLRLHP